MVRSCDLSRSRWSSSGASSLVCDGSELRERVPRTIGTVDPTSPSTARESSTGQPLGPFVHRLLGQRASVSDVPVSLLA